MGGDFLALTVQVVGGVVGGCMVSHLLRASDMGPLGHALLGALGGAVGAGMVASASPGLVSLPGLSGLLVAGALAGGLSTFLGGLAVSALRRRT
ncbi:MAG: hypothetical protein ACKOD3_00355 [Phenylobacterium sp.]